MTHLGTYLFYEILSQLGIFAQLPFKSFIDIEVSFSLYNRYITKNYINKILVIILPKFITKKFNVI